jgi:hypothetical protein
MVVIILSRALATFCSWNRIVQVYRRRPVNILYYDRGREASALLKSSEKKQKKVEGTKKEDLF